jgi:hypothetical protein
LRVCIQTLQSVRSVQSCKHTPHTNMNMAGLTPLEMASLTGGVQFPSSANARHTQPTHNAAPSQHKRTKTGELRKPQKPSKKTVFKALGITDMNTKDDLKYYQRCAQNASSPSDPVNLKAQCIAHVKWEEECIRAKSVLKYGFPLPAGKETAGIIYPHDENLQRVRPRSFRVRFTQSMYALLGL